METATESRLKATLEDYFTDKLGGRCRGDFVKSLSGGACMDNYRLKMQITEGGEAGDYDLVLRTDKGGSLFSSLSRAEEFTVSKLAYENNVKTPRPFWKEEDTSVIGNPFYVMQFIDGKATGRYIVKDRSLNEVRPRLAGEVATQLAAIHAVTMDDHKDTLPFFRQPANAAQYIKACIDEVRDGLDELVERHPALELALWWFEKYAVDVDRFVLVHGDFRTGNFMVSPDGLQGVVDWEFAHWGDRHEDIAWLCMRDWRFGKNNLEAGGFAERQQFYDAYTDASGFEIDPRRVTFWEIMGNVRWAMGACQQSERHLSGKDRGIELAAIGRRAAEMEYEVMRMIDAVQA